MSKHTVFPHLCAILVPTLRTDQVLFLLMQDEMSLETGHAREALATLRAHWVVCLVDGQVEPQVVLHIEGLTALRALVWLVILVAPHMALVLCPLGEHFVTLVTLEGTLDI